MPRLASLPRLYLGRIIVPVVQTVRLGAFAMGACRSKEAAVETPEADASSALVQMDETPEALPSASTTHHGVSRVA